MARARNIKPSTFKNELLGEADPLLTILFVGLWCLADREGRLEDRPKRIKAEIFPYREIADINGYLTELERMDFIRRYSVDGEQYILVKNFVKHQSPHKTEKDSEIPPPPEKSDSCPVTDKTPLNNESSPVKESLIPDSLIPDPLIPEVSAEPPAPAPSVTLPLNDKTEFPIFENQIAEWQELYPAADVRQELRNMRGWLIGNPQKRKTKSGILRFVTSWLAKEQNRGGANGQVNHAPKPNAFDRAKQRLAEWERSQTGGTVVDGQVVGSND